MSEHVDIDAAGAPAFGLADELEPGEGAPHVHGRHQLLYASVGTLRLHVDGATWLLPPMRAAVLRAGVEHTVDVAHRASLRTTYLAPALLPWEPPVCAVFPVSPLARELLLAAVRWGPEHDDPTGSALFALVARLAERWVEEAVPWRLPRARTPELARVLRWAGSRLDEDLGAADAARIAHVSERTLTRRFRDELGVPWQGWLRLARMLRAMELLADPDRSVTEVALEVGYSSLPTFSRVFAEVAGAPPSVWRLPR